MTNYRGKTVLILGLGISGRAAARYLLSQGARVLGIDQKIDQWNEDAAFQDLCRLGLQPLEKIDGTLPLDAIIKSPGIPNEHSWIQTLYNQAPVFGEIDLACEALTKRQKKLLAITGSNGKTTTTLLTTHILNAAGVGAVALGNVGTPLIAQLMSVDDPEVYVVELSSYQLETLAQKIFNAGVILNITPNHLDRYSSMYEYAKAKFRLGSCLKEGAKLFVQEEALTSFDELVDKTKTERLFVEEERAIFHEKVATFLSLSYRDVRNHDVENVRAAFQLCRTIGVSDAAFWEGVKGFRPPPHRIEFVRTVKGVTYINDSKATSVDAVKKAIETLSQPCFVIAGGVDKGSDFREWIPLFRGRVKKVLVFGKAAQKIEEELMPIIAVERVVDLKAAVVRASLIAKEGEIVILSPGCASLDMFKDYQERGERFKQLVFEL